MEQNEKKVVMISIGACLVLVVILNIIILVARNPRHDTATQITSTVPAGGVVVSPTRSVSLVPTTPPVQLQKLKTALTAPVKSNDLTIEYRKSSNTWIVFYNGDKAAAQKNVDLFFQSHNVSSYPSEVFDYISLDAPKDTGEK